MEVRNYCGCCARVIRGVGALLSAEWCRDCSLHVAKEGQAYDRTYFAQTGRECPYQDGEVLDTVGKVLNE